MATHSPGGWIILGIVFARLTTFGTIIVAVLAKANALFGMAKDTEAVTLAFALRLVALLALEGHRTLPTIILADPFTQ